MAVRTELRRLQTLGRDAGRGEGSSALFYSSLLRAATWRARSLADAFTFGSTPRRFTQFRALVWGGFKFVRGKSNDWNDLEIFFRCLSLR